MKKVLYALTALAMLALPSMAFAAPSTITVERSPGPPQTVLNNGLGKVSYGGRITFDPGVAYAYVLRVLSDTDSDGLADEDPANDVCRVNGHPTGAPITGNMATAVSPFIIPAGECVIPNASPVGRYLVSVHFYIKDDPAAPDYDPDNPYRTDADARATFYVSSPAQVGTLVVKKAEDLNGNGVLDTNEKGLAGWQFTITPPSSTELTGEVESGTVFTAQTDANGEIKLVGLAPGQYVIKETAQTGWVAISSSELTKSVSANTVTDAVFMNARPASVCGFVREDVDGNGQNTAADNGLVGRIMELLGLTPKTEQTGDDGGYCFQNLNPGDYEVKLQSCGEGMTVIDDTDGITTGEPGSIKFSLVSGEDKKEQNVLCLPQSDSTVDDPAVDPDEPQDPEVVAEPPKVTG